MKIRVLCASLALAFAGCANAVPAAPFTVKIIGFNDYHGNLQSPGKFSVNTATSSSNPDNRPAVGGAEFVASFVGRLKAQNPLNVVVGAGDVIGASPLISALFYDEASVETLNRIGLEFNAVGNHEFDHGSTELLRLQNGGCVSTAQQAADNKQSCIGNLVGTPQPFEGAKFKWLSANVVSTATGKTLLPAYGIKTFNGVKVAFIGMTLKDTPTIVTPTGVAGLQFNDEAATVNALVPKLRQQGVEAIVVLVHQGGFQGSGLGDINGCDGKLVGSDIAKIVSQLDNAVDLVVSGHTHAAYNCSASTVSVVTQKDASGNVIKDASGNSLTVSTPAPTGLPNKIGRLIPVTSASAFGRVLSDINVTIDPATRDITTVSVNNLLVDRSDAQAKADVAQAGTTAATVKSIVDAYNTQVSPIAGRVIGSITTDLTNSNTFDRSCNMPAGDLIADSQLAATAAPGFGDAVIAFMNRGGVRNPGFVFSQVSNGEAPGDVTYGEAFTVQPFGNSLVTMTLTAQNIKDALEQQFAGCKGQASTATRILLASKGFKYFWDGSKACGSRISNVTLTRNGTTETLVDATGAVVSVNSYRVTVNNFLATGGDGFGTFLQGTNLLGGAQDIDALAAYMSANFLTPKPAYADNTAPEDNGSRRINRVAAGNGNVCPASVSNGNVNP